MQLESTVCLVFLLLQVKITTKDRETCVVDKMYPHAKPWYSAVVRPFTEVDNSRIADSVKLLLLQPCGLQWILCEDKPSVKAYHQPFS